MEDITLQGIRAAAELYNNSGLKRSLLKYHGDKTDAMFWAWAGTWTREEFRNWNIEHFLPAVKCPVLVIQGEHDEYGTLRQVERIVELTGGEASACIVKGARHTPHKETADQVLIKTAEFIRKLTDNQVTEQRRISQ